MEAAKIRLSERGVAGSVRYVEADAYDIAKVIGEPVDHVFLANIFHGVPDRGRMSRAVHDVLRPGGVFAVVNWHARPREETTILGEPRGPPTELRMTPAATIAAVEQGGLQHVDTVEVSPYHYGAVFRR